MHRFWFFLAMLCVPLIVGCEGCRRDAPDDAEDKKEQEAPKQDFVARPSQAFPGDETINGGAIKPGHWITGSITLQSNKLDARGELSSVCGTRGVSLRSGNQTQSTGSVPNLRPVVMPKGQQRRFDYRLLPPPPTSSEQSTCFLSSRFTASNKSLFFEPGSQPFRMMRSQEYFMVVLTTRSERFAKLRQSDWAKQYYDTDQFEIDPLRSTRIHYRIVIPKTDGVLPIADTMLDWTSTAVVLWDDLPGDALTPDQMTAMNDWLHFGGRLIVNGADGADQIAMTTLADALPLKPTSNIELAPSAAVELLTQWQVPSDRSIQKQIALVNGQGGRVVVDGIAAKDAITLPNSGNLVLRRRVGRGHIVQPRFDIASDWFRDWDSSQSFFNAAMLGRPGRSFVKNTNNDPVTQTFTGTLKGASPASRNRAVQSEAAINSDFRIFSRDASLSGDTYFRADPVTGLSGWKDDSDVLKRCSDILRSESGIEIPKSAWVMKSLGIYLMILVPLNYLVFRLLGRLEYAWMAVPVIAIAGAIWVARAAQLDIGFARSQNEVALLELQPGYHRGHLTRVLAIYNSLSSSYDLQFKTIDGCAAPMDLYRNPSRRTGDALGDTLFRTSFDEGPALAGVSIDSNQIRLMHVEQIVDAGGGFEWVPSRDVQNDVAEDATRSDPVTASDFVLINDSSLELQDAFVVSKDSEGEVQVAVLGACAAGSKTTPKFRTSKRVAIPADLPMQMKSLLGRITAPENIPPGSTRLVARIDGSIDGCDIRPSAGQQQAQTLVLVHLTHSPASEPEIDKNLLSDFLAVTNLEDQESTP